MSVKHQKRTLAEKLMRYRTVTFIIIVLLAVGLAYPAVLYFQSTSLDMKAPKGTRSKDDLPAIKKLYNALPSEEQLVLMITNESVPEGSTLCNQFIADATLKAKLQQFSTYTSAASFTYSKYFIKQLDPLMAVSQFPLAASQFCSQRSMLIDQIWNNSYDGVKVVDHLKTEFKAKFKEIFSDYKELDFYVVSEQAMMKDCNDGTVQDLMKLDSISIVCGLIIIALYLKNIKLLIITLLNLIFSFAISFGLCYFVSLGFTVATFAPSVQSAAMCALNFDYCLFLFSRLNEELAKGKSAMVAIENMLIYSGKVCLVSGCCLTLVCLFLCICPVQLVQSIGLCTGISVFALVIVNILDATCMLMFFPKFFMGKYYPFTKGDLFCKCTKHWQEIKFEDYDIDEHKELPKSGLQKFITKYVSYCIDHKWLIILLLTGVLLLAVPFAPFVVKVKYSMNLENIIPKHSKALKAINKFGDEFNPGLSQPYYIVINKTVSGSTDTLLNTESFHLTQQLINRLLTDSVTHFSKKQMTQLILRKEDIISPAFVTTNVTAEQITQLRAIYNAEMAGADVSSYGNMVQVANSLMFLLGLTTPNSKDISTMAIMMTPYIPLTSKDSNYFIPWIRDILDEYEPKFKAAGMGLYEYSSISPMTDSVDKLFKTFPTIIGVTFVIMFVILGVVFRSVIAPVRMLIETILVMAFYYGIAIKLFQFDHVHDNEALFWATVFISFSISIGLCSDYDIFSYSGISVQMEKSDDVHKAIITGSENVGVVMVAGIIMMVACSGLLFSSLDMLLQFGVCLVMDLAFDTLVVVPIVVPCISILFGKANLWPGNLMKKRRYSSMLQSNKSAELAAQKAVEETDKEQKTEDDARKAQANNDEVAEQKMVVAQVDKGEDNMQ